MNTAIVVLTMLNLQRVAAAAQKCQETQVDPGTEAAIMTTILVVFVVGLVVATWGPDLLRRR